MNTIARSDWLGLEKPALEAASDPAREIKTGGLVALLFFVVLLGWATLAPLDAGVHAAGKVAVAGNRQSVQHRDGGIVTAIHVREGERVRAGQLLIELAAPELQAAERALTSDYLNLLAQRARLLAERSGSDEFAVPPEFANLDARDRDLAAQAFDIQRQQLRAERAALSAQQSVLGQRSAQIGEQQTGFSRQQASIREQQRILAEELEGMRELQKRGFASLNRIRALERAQEELRGREAEMVAQIARSAEGIGEARMQALSLSRTKLEDSAVQLSATEARISEVLPKLLTAREQLQRTKVHSPASGQVVGLSVFTVGGVVAPGQTLMEVVPDDKRLVIQVRVDPQGADDVFVGQEAQVRFSSVEDRSLPILKGRVRTISADRLVDETTGQPFFEAEVEVSPSELSLVSGVLGKGQLRPGLPAEAVLAIRKRTALQFLLEPLSGHFWRSLRQQ